MVPMGIDSSSRLSDCLPFLPAICSRSVELNGVHSVFYFDEFDADEHQWSLDIFGAVGNSGAISEIWTFYRNAGIPIEHVDCAVPYSNQ